MENFKIIPTETFTLKIGETELHGFKKESEWQGFTKYADNFGDYVICIRENITAFFDSMDLSSEKGLGHTPIAASPKIQRLLIEKQNVKAKGSTTNQVLDEMKQKILDPALPILTYTISKSDSSLDVVDEHATREGLANFIVSFKTSNGE